LIKDVLIDTEIWIDFLNGKNSSLNLVELLETNRVRIHPFIEGELRVGIIKNRSKFLELLQSVKRASEISQDVLFLLIENEELFGKGLSIIDIHIYAASLVDHLLVWTNDKNLKKICERKGILFLGGV
jgi:predicted nucleic acid-binding protein